MVTKLFSVVGFGSSGPEFKSHFAVELIPGGVDSACHPSEVGKMRTSLLGWLSHLSILHQSGEPSMIVPNRKGDCFGSTNALQRVWSRWIDGRFRWWWGIQAQLFMNCMAGFPPWNLRPDEQISSLSPFLTSWLALTPPHDVAWPCQLHTHCQVWHQSSRGLTPKLLGSPRRFKMA